VTGQKDQPHQEVTLHQVPIKPKVPDHQKNTTMKAPAKKDPFRHQVKAALTNPQAALAAALVKRKHLPGKAGHIQEDQQMPVNHPAKKEHLHQKAGLIPAGPPITTQGQEKVSAGKEQVIKNLLHRAANQQDHLMLMINLKEVLVAKDQVISPLHRAANHQQVHLMLMINLKEVLEAIKNSATGHLQALALKDQPATGLTMLTSRSANQNTIK
jgi:hypothetical protein